MFAWFWRLFQEWKEPLSPLIKEEISMYEWEQLPTLGQKCRAIKAKFNQPEKFTDFIAKIHRSIESHAKAHYAQFCLAIPPEYLQQLKDNLSKEELDFTIDENLVVTFSNESWNPSNPESLGFRAKQSYQQPLKFDIESNLEEIRDRIRRAAYREDCYRITYLVAFNGAPIGLNIVPIDIVKEIKDTLTSEELEVSEEIELTKEYNKEVKRLYLVVKW